MKIIQKKVTKITLTELKNLDNICIFLEDYSPGRGQITINCYDKSWVSFWGAMGENNTLSEFFCSCDNHYLSKKLAPQTKSSIPETDIDEIKKHAIAEIVKDRRVYDISEQKARDLFERLEYAKPFPLNQELWRDIYGEEYWDYLPQMENHEWTYLCRIIDAAKAGLKESQNSQKKDGKK